MAFTYLKLNPSSAFIYVRWSWSCYFGLGLKNLVLFTSLVAAALQSSHSCDPCIYNPRKLSIHSTPLVRRQSTAAAFGPLRTPVTVD